METIVTAIAGILFNKFLEKSGENLAGVFATQVGGALAKIGQIHPKAAEALAAGNPQVIDGEIIKEVNQQAEIDPELRSMLAKIAELTQDQFTPEELAKLKASQNAEEAAETIRTTGKKQIDSIQAENIGMIVKEQSTANVKELRVGNTKIEKQINVNQSGTSNTQTNNFNP